VDLIDLDEAPAIAEQRFCLRLRLGIDFRRINDQVRRTTSSRMEASSDVERRKKLAHSKVRTLQYRFN
jgi:hypothetical protein